MRSIRKVLSLLLALLLVMNLGTPAFAEETPAITLTVDKTDVAVGDTVTVTVGSTGISDVFGIGFKVCADQAVYEVESIETTWTSNNQLAAKGWIKIATFSSSGNALTPPETIAVIKLKAKAAAETSSISLSSLEVTKTGADGTSTEPVTVTSPEAIATVVKESVVTAYGITIGTITNGTVTADKATADAGETVNLTVTPAEGYELDTLTVMSGETAVEVTENAFTMPAGEVTVSATFKQVITVTGYTVAASEDVSITAGENAEVSITVTEADSKAYNAYELNVTYPEGLTYVSASGSGVTDDNFKANHDEAGRTIQIIGYGADKDSGTAAAKLTFTGSATGEYDVTISSAKVDAAASAPTQDTPDATIGDAATKITITGYTVTLGEGLTADSFVAYPGTAYTFKATDADNYDYTVTAKVGETEINVSNNGDGTYTIPADQITGNITVSAAMNPKSYDVTYDGTTTENAATYNTPYTFTPAKDGYTVGSVTVTIGGEGYTGYNTENGTYIIPGEAITGDIVITVEWIEKTPTTVTVGKSEGVIGGENATQGTDYTFSFGDTDNYEYDEETLVVKVGETDITEQVTKNEETGEYTIPGSLITGNITISIERTAKATFTVEVSEYLTLDEGNKMYLVTVKGVEDGKVAKYDGQNMFWSAQTLTTGENGEETTGYGAYAWLVISNEGLDAVKTAAPGKVSTAEGTTNLTVDYSGDVNGTEKVDVNDAQLVYNMYNAYYGDFTTVSMQKFLKADVNGSKNVNVEDAAAIVAEIIKAK